MAETLYIDGIIQGELHQTVCDDVGMNGSPAVMGWITSLIGPVYDYDAALGTLNQMVRLFGSQRQILLYTDAGTTVLAPVIDRLEPQSLAQSGSDVTLRVFGQGFTPRSQIVLNGGLETTTSVSPTKLTTVIVGATATTPGRFPVLVRTAAPGGGDSTGRRFYVLAPGEKTVKRWSRDGLSSWLVPASEA